MGEPPPELLRTTDVLTRLALAADRLEIDHAGLHARLPELGTAPGRAARISLDLDGRLALRCQPDRAAMLDLGRPDGARWLELETVPRVADVAELELGFGPRAAADDRALLAAAGIAPAVCDELEARLSGLGDGRRDLLGRRTEGGDVTWLTGVVGSPGEPVAELVAAVSRLTALAGALGIPAGQRKLLGEAHTLFAPGKPYAVALACTSERVLPQLMIEYADVAWHHVAGLAGALRPGIPWGPRLGTFAGAFDAAQASAFELTLRASGDAGIRAAITRGGAAS